jgi:hypothetical protein
MKSSLRISLAHAICLLGGIATGAGLMYLLDPNTGEKRRQAAGHGLGRWLTALSAFAGRTVATLRSAAREAVMGIYAESARGEFADRVLAERVRGELRRLLSHPGSIQVIARDGRVVLWGPVLAGEPEKLRPLIARLPGVQHLELLLTIRDESRGNAPVVRAS